MRIARLAGPVALIAALAAAPVLGAETLAGDVPADALLFVQWAGTDSVGPAYAASHTKGMVDAFQVHKLMDIALAQHRAGATDAQHKMAEQAVGDLFSAATKSPTALYVGPMDLSDPEKPVVKVALFSKVGRDAASTLAQEMTTAINGKPHKDGEPPVAAVAVNDFVLITVGADIDIDKRLAGATPGDLASTESYKSTMARVTEGGAEPAAQGYINAQAALRTLDDVIAAKAPPQQSRNWPMVEAALNLDAMQAFGFAGNFDGADWTSRVFVGLAENRAGVAAFLDSTPLPENALANVPSTATWMTVTRFDGPRLLDDMRNAAANMMGGGANGQRKFDMGLQQFFAFTGVDLKKDLLPSLGDAYYFYGTPDAQGHSLTNFVMVSPLKNAQTAQKSLDTLETFTNAMAGQRDPNTRLNFKTETLPAPNDKVTLHTIALATMAPSWTIANGNLYFSLTKEGVIQALADAGKHSSLAENATYAEARKHIAQPSLSRVTYLDVPAVAPELYAIFSKAFADFKTQHAKELGDYELPPLATLMPAISPAILASWTDAAGWHLQIHGDSPLAGSAAPLFTAVSEAAKREKAAAPPKGPAAPALP